MKHWIRKSEKKSIKGNPKVLRKSRKMSGRKRKEEREIGLLRHKEFKKDLQSGRKMATEGSQDIFKRTKGMKEGRKLN